MLSPEQIEAAGDAVAAVYNDIEAQMLDHLVNNLLTGDYLTQKSLTAITLLSQTNEAELWKILRANKGAIDAAVYDAVVNALSASDFDDIARIGGTPAYPQQVTATIAGVAEILSRDNLQMIEGAKKAFLDASIEAITRVNTGAMTTEKALHAAVRELEKKGIPIITYQNRKTKRVTVENKIDVAVRRHIRTQIAQDGARMSLERMEDLGVYLVEVSSHDDARPSHAAWQGRCYSLRGDTVIDGTRYPDFYSSTGYGQVDGLLGANCRHSFGPYRHGAPRMYSPHPQSPSGLKGSEIYELEQGQRKLERDIRAAKRELRGAQQVYEALGSNEALAALNKAKNELKTKQSEMRSYIKEANAKGKPGTTVLHRQPYREWAGDMPRPSKDIQIGRSVGAAAYRDQVKLPDGTFTRISAGAKITGIVSIAGSGTDRKIDEINILMEQFGGSRSNWVKKRGTTYVNDLGLERPCEVHWYENGNGNRYKMKVKKFYP